MKRILNIASGLLLLFSSFFIYPAESAFFLMPAMVMILFKPLSEWSLTRKQLIRDISFFLCGIMGYFIIAKIIQHVLISGNFPGGYTFNLNFKYGERILGLIQVFPSLWNIDYQFNFQTLLVYAVLLLGVILSAGKYFRSNLHKSQPTIIWQVIAGVFLIMGFASSFYLAQPSNMIFTRILYIYQVMSVIILIWAIMTITRVDKIILYALIGLFFLSSGYSNYIVTKSALNDNMEFNYLVSYLENYLNSKTKRIHIIGLNYESKSNFNGMTPRDDIYNINSTIYRQDSFYMVHAAFKQLLQPGSYNLYNCALDEFQLMETTEEKCIDSAPANSLIVTYSRRGEPVNQTPDTLIVDMSENAIPNLIVRHYNG